MVVRISSVYEVLDNKKTTTTKVSMDFLEIPQPSLREDSCNWSRRPGTFVLKMSSVFLWTKCNELGVCQGSISHKQ